MGAHYLDREGDDNHFDTWSCGDTPTPKPTTSTTTTKTTTTTTTTTTTKPPVEEPDSDEV